MTAPIPLGHNPIRWRCDIQGCFNLKCRPKVEVFARCFPGRINFGDLDYWVEIGGFFLLLEWKHRGGILSTGQALAFTAFTKQREGNIVFVVQGDEETMSVQQYLSYWNGQQSPWQPASLLAVKIQFMNWATWARQAARQELILRKTAA